MVDDDTFSYHVKQQPTDQKNRAQANTAAHSLITKERKQKFDLLLHLLSNLTQSLVVCGPEGIGKTTLLKILLERKTESWRYCVVQDNANLSFEAIQDQLAKTIIQGRSVQSLSTALELYESEHRQVILIVDNAGELVPGLISAIIQYAAANPVLRVVFALTHEELQVKRGSDRVIDDCHIIEIPPLSEKQCGDFLQYLLTKPPANLLFKEISESMVAHIYQGTHGVPGRIIDELSGAKQGGKLKWILTLAVAGLCAVVFGNQWLASKRNDTEVSAPTITEQKTDKIETVPSQPESKIIPTQSAQPINQQQGQSVSTNDVKKALEPSVEVNTHKDNQQSVVPTEKIEAVGSAAAKQPSENKSSDGGQQNITELLGALRETSKQSEPSKTVNEVGGAVPKNTEIKAHSERVSAVDADNKRVVGTQQKVTEPLGVEASREKSKQSEIGTAVHDAGSSIPENLGIKTQSEPVSADGVDQKTGIKQSDAIQQKIAGPIGVTREKPKKSVQKK